MADISAGGILVAKNERKGGYVGGLVAEAARREGVSPFRMLREILMVRRAPGRMTEQEYFDFELHSPALGKQEKRQFVGRRGNAGLNLSLSPPLLNHMRGFLRDKVAFTALLQTFGLPTTETQALVSRDRKLGTLPCLRDAEDIVRFLSGEARYPLFCKPVRGSRAVGTAAIDAIDAGTGRAMLADGSSVAVWGLAEEILRDFPDGYMFQTKVAQHPEVAALTGNAVGTVRIVTVIEEDSPRVLYAVWKIPSPSAMSDNFWQAGSLLCRLDHETGEVLACRSGKGAETRWHDTHPATGRPFAGLHLPNWDKITKVAVDAHAIFPINGMLGWDIAIGPEGGIVIECNANPGHEFYQLATKRGILNPEMQAIFDRVIARNRRIAEALKGRY